MKLIDEKNDALLARKTVVFETEIGQNPTPSREGVRETIAKYLNTDKKLVIVDEIKSFFRENKIQIIARVYQNIEDLKRIEDSNLLKRHKEEEPKKEEVEETTEAPAEEKKEKTETPKEDKEESTENKEA